MNFSHRFVDTIPECLEEGVLYVSIPYDTCLHNCACGCGREVVMPLSVNDWRMTYNGESVSLSPSIGNWSYPCRSHYWIKQGRVVWAESWSEGKVLEERAADTRKLRKDGQEVKTKWYEVLLGTWFGWLVNDRWLS
jgi:hypothetical protein